MRTLLIRFLGQSSNRKFWQLLVVTSAFKLVYLSLPNLVPQEAYHWAWIQFPDWSYFDHPPLVAYSIGLFTHVFGDHVFWVRFPVWLYSIGDAALLYAIAKRLLDSTRPALWTLAAFNLAPLFLIGSIIMTPDVPLIFFWLLTVYLFVRAVDEGRWKWWMLAGASAGAAMLGKYPGVLLFPGALLFLALSRQDQHWLRKPQPYLTVIPAILVFSPVLIWNAQHEWVSLLFQTSRRANEVTQFRLDTFLQLLTGQLGIVNPILFCGYVFSMVYVVKKRLILRDRRYAFLFSFSVLPMTVVVLISLMYFVKMNWPAPAYVTGFMLVALLFIENQDKPRWRTWPRTAFVLGLVLMVATYAVPVIPIRPIPGDTWTGWPELGKRISEIRAEMQQNNHVFVFGNEYKVSVETWFHNQGKLRTFSKNVLSCRALQFDYFPGPDSCVGFDAVFAYADLEPFGDLAWLNRHFDRVETEPVFEVKRREKVFRRFYIYRCFGYKGPIEREKEKAAKSTKAVSGTKRNRNQGSNSVPFVVLRVLSGYAFTFPSKRLLT